jgi:hypothetical protein
MTAGAVQDSCFTEQQSDTGVSRISRFSLGISRFAVRVPQNWAMSRPLAQFFVAAPQSQTQLMFEPMKVGQFSPYVGQLLFQSAAHRRAWL